MMKGNQIVIIFALSFLCLCGYGVSQVINLPTGGSVVGVEGEGWFSYRGIPYAQPPVGDLRWTAPQDYKITTQYTATEFKPACPQVSSFDLPEYATNEDCLYLNIWTPKNVDSALPVMVYLHGGGWESGSGSLPLYWGDFLANTTNTILVTLNYRLGALGFLVSEEIGGNFGFLDQRMALTWVQTYIQYFKGDPFQVTLFGQSAGGMSVTAHLTSQGSFGLFNRSISHSGPPVITFRTQEQSYYFSNQFEELIGCANSTDVVSCMRAANSTLVIEAQRKVLPNLETPWQVNNFLIWMPVIDNVYIFDTPENLINNGQTAPLVDMIWGSTRNETAGWIIDFLPSVPILVSEYKLLLKQFFGDNYKKVFNEYPANDASEVRDALSLLSTDWLFTCSMKHSAKAMSTLNNGGAIREFVFLHPPSSDPRATGTVAHCADIQEVCHGAELDYVFHSAAFANATFTTEENTLSLQCLNIWSSYAHNAITQEEWPVYNLSEDNSLGINIENITEIFNYRASYCDFWESLNTYGTIL